MTGQTTPRERIAFARGMTQSGEATSAPFATKTEVLAYHLPPRALVEGLAHQPVGAGRQGIPSVELGVPDDRDGGRLGLGSAIDEHAQSRERRRVLARDMAVDCTARPTQALR